ncbi:tRNA methyltransferase [Aeropyrum camini SY1 = JCM 12091]|uniref:tRNA methyltransferase n=1 Tax=Aeropyrum camini SY1 = JCM 12091 TaxID=1198449 RepID=U3TI49_9CREN|nr:tRNA methyltransferase [Aeropyrum camini SY1 = JCM 12091]
MIAESMKGERRSYYIRISAESTYSTIAGVIAARKILGKPWGVLLRSRLGAVAVVKPSIAELMEGFYERRTQVIYPKDSGLIAILAGARPEARLLEAGVGSGFLTTVLAMGLCPTGRLIGLDVKRENLEAARRNLESAGLLDCVDLKLGDVRDPAAVEGVGPLDGVVLDMPDPWSALESLGPEVKPSAVAVAFVPTSTQLEKLLDHLPGGWMLQGGVETMARTINLSPGAVRPGEWLASFTGYIVVLRRVVQG